MALWFVLENPIKTLRTFRFAPCSARCRTRACAHSAWAGWLPPLHNPHRRHPHNCSFDLCSRCRSVNAIDNLYWPGRSVPSVPRPAICRPGMNAWNTWTTCCTLLWCFGSMSHPPSSPIHCSRLPRRVVALLSSLSVVDAPIIVLPPSILFKLYSRSTNILYCLDELYCKSVILLRKKRREEGTFLINPPM